MNSRSIGKEKEREACEYLIENGYEILETNFNSRQGEIDIIARIDEYICFTEVKYRKSAKTGLPEEAVSISKMKKISRTALYYLYQNPQYSKLQMRFDVLAIEDEDIRFYENAFMFVN